MECLDEEARATGVPCFFVPTLIRYIRPITDIRACIDLYRLLRRIQPDIVHTHSSKAGILGRIAAYLAGVPVIIHTFHGFGFTPQQKKWLRNILIRVEQVCALLSTHLVFVSEENRTIAAQENIGRTKPTSLIRSGIAIQPDGPARLPAFGGDEKRQSQRAIRQKLKIPEGSWVVTYVGNFKPQKNTMDLARVAVQVAPSLRGRFLISVWAWKLGLPTSQLPRRWPAVACWHGASGSCRSPTSTM